VKPANVNVAIEDTTRHGVALARDSDRLRQHRLDRQRFLELGRAPDSVRGQVRTSWRRSVLSGVIPDRLLLPFDSDMDRAGRLLAAARPVLHRLAATLDGTNTSFLLTDRSGLVLQPDFVIFMLAWLAAGSGRFWRGAGSVAARQTIAAGAGHLGPA